MPGWFRVLPPQLYRSRGDALPKGLLNQDDAGLIMRGITLAQSQSVPESLITGLLDDVELFIEQ